MNARFGLAALLLAAPLAARADDDLNLIPDTLPPEATTTTQSPAAAPGGNIRAYLENATTSFTHPINTAAPAPGRQPNWQERVLLDLNADWAVSPELHAIYSGRLNAEAEDTIQNPGPHTLRHDFREGYASWQPRDGLWIDAGRINQKDGVAVGYNPTDFFRARAVVDPLTNDPAVLREDRLGSVMLRVQRVWSGGSALLAYSPRLAAPGPIVPATQLHPLDPLFDHTNTTDRILAKLSLTLADDVVPEFVAFHEGAQSRVGLNLTRNVSSSTVLYAEWSGGAQSSLAAEAVSFGQLTGTLPVLTHVPLPLQEGGWRNEMSVGGSYAPGGEVVINLEYHDHEAGLSGAAWRTWFAAASAGSPGLRAALWYIRAYAQDQQEPVGRHAIFLRASWNDALVHDLELDGLASVSLQDGSAQAQFQATYDINEHWRLGGLVSFVTGSQTTEFGSQPQALTVLASLRRYF